MICKLSDQKGINREYQTNYQLPNMSNISIRCCTWAAEAGCDWSGIRITVSFEFLESPFESLESSKVQK